MFKLCLHSKFQTAEHLCFPRVPVEDLPQFIARSRFESAGMGDSMNPPDTKAKLAKKKVPKGEKAVNHVVQIEYYIDKEKTKKGMVSWEDHYVQ